MYPGHSRPWSYDIKDHLKSYDYQIIWEFGPYDQMSYHSSVLCAKALSGPDRGQNLR